MGSYGDYWSASYDDSYSAYSAYHVSFRDSYLDPSYYYYRDDGQSVRLVRSAR